METYRLCLGARGRRFHDVDFHHTCLHSKMQPLFRESKIAILISSLLAGLFGYGTLRVSIGHGSVRATIRPGLE